MPCTFFCSKHLYIVYSLMSGDDSDVDIETVTETPKSADTGGSSSVLRPSASPEPICKIQNGSLLSIASKAAGSSTRKVCHSPSLLTSKSVTSQNVHKTSSMALAENITTNRSHLPGHKRKLAKDKKLSKAQAHSVYTHVLCNSNSVNFHDYAMSPGACTYTSSPSSSTETARPTVMSKRIYKRQIPVGFPIKPGHCLLCYLLLTPHNTTAFTFLGQYSI